MRLGHPVNIARISTQDAPKTLDGTMDVGGKCGQMPLSTPYLKVYASRDIPG